MQAQLQCSSFINHKEDLQLQNIKVLNILRLQLYCQQTQPELYTEGMFLSFVQFHQLRTKNINTPPKKYYEIEFDM